MARIKRVIPEVINDVEILKQWIPRLASGEVQVEIHEDEDGWLEARKKGLGGSDIAGILGLSKWTTPLKIWRQKQGLEPDTDATWQMALGTENESLIAGVWAAKQGCRLIKIPFLRDVANPHRAASVDFLAVFPDGYVEIVEVKWSKGMDDVPDYYFTQVTWYEAITGIHTGRLVSGGDRNEPDDGLPVPWEDSLSNDIVTTADEWWKAHILIDVAPEPMSDTEIAEDLADKIRLLASNGVDADAAVTTTANQLLSLRRKIKELNAQSKLLKIDLAKHLRRLGSQKVVGDGWTASFIQKRGNIKYSEIVHSLGWPQDELEKHRGKSSGYLSVRGEGDEDDSDD